MRFHVIWLAFISFFISSVQAVSLEELISELQGGIPKAGAALVGRVRNETKFPAGIRFKKGIHDAFPEQTIVRIKSLDPTLGAGGKYFVIKKDMDDKFTLAPLEGSAEKAAKFTVSRRLSRNLRDWLGFSSIDAAGSFARMDKSSNRIVFDAREGDFKDENCSDCHWMIPEGMTPAKAMLVNRETQAPLYTYKGKKDVIIKEEKKPVDDVWGITKQGRMEPVFDPNADLKYGDRIKVFNVDTGKWFVAKVLDDQAKASEQSVSFNSIVRLLLDDGRYICPAHGHQWWLTDNRGDGQWERLTILDGDGKTPQRVVKYNDLVTFKTWETWQNKMWLLGFSQQSRNPFGLNYSDGVTPSAVQQLHGMALKEITQRDGSIVKVPDSISGRGRYVHSELRVDNAMLYRKIHTGAPVPVPGVMRGDKSVPGVVWGTDTGYDTYVRTGITSKNPKGTGWTQVAGKYRYVAVSPDGLSVWGLADEGWQGGPWNGHSAIYFRVGVTPANPTGTAWEKFEGGLVQISVGKDGYVWGVNGNGQIYIRLGVTPTNRKGTAWRQIDGGLKHVSIGPDGHVWGVNHGNQVFFREGVSAGNPGGNRWIHVQPGSIQQISVGPGGACWGVGMDNAAYVREGITSSNPIGTGWKPVPGNIKCKYLSMSPKGQLWAISDSDQIYFRNNVTAQSIGTDWEGIDLETTRLKQLSAGPLWIGVKEKADQSSEGMFAVAVINPNEAWGINVQNKLFKWDGKEWKEKPVGFPVKDVAASPFGDIYLIASDQKLYQRLSKKDGTLPIKLPDYYDCKGIKQLAVVNSSVIWGLDVDGKISSFNGLMWESKVLPENIKAASIAATFDGTTRAVDEGGVLWEYNNDAKKWETRDRTADNAKLVRLSGDFAVSDKRKWYRYAGGGWTGPLAGEYDDVIAANGFDLIRETKNLDVEVATTLTMDGKSKPIDDKTSLQLEIVKLGMGGQIEPNGGAISFDALPVTKSPSVYGISIDKLPRLEPGVPLTIPPMRGQGGAYPEVSFPGNGTFVATVSAGDQGGIHLILSDKIGDSYKIRAVIGGSNNAGSSILKQVYDGAEAKDLKLLSISPEEHPFAKVEADKYKQYWISYTLDKVGKKSVGKIKVGQGEVGEGIFMACADPNPGDAPTRAAVGSERQELNCVQPKFDDPVRVKKPRRIYRTFENIPQGAIPFRILDRGAISFQVTASGPVSVLLEQPVEVGRDHYRVVFGDKKNTGIGIYKWKNVKVKKGESTEEKEQYAPCIFLPNASFPEIALSPTKSKQFWISFDQGEFIVGMGNIGENDLLIYQDVLPHEQIATCRFSSQAAAQIKDVSVSPDVQLYVARKTESYKQEKKGLDLYGGGVTMLIPFDWKFDQDGAAVTTFDNITLKGPDRIAGTPIPGAFYTFNLTLKPDGTPDLQWLQAPENPTQKKMQRALVKADSEAAFKKQQSEILSKQITTQGALDKQTKMAEAARLGAAFEQSKDVATALAEVGGKIGAGGIVGQVIAGVSGAASIAAVAAGQVFKGMEAAKVQEATMVEINAQRRALEKETARETEAAKLKMQRDNLEGEMNLAFTGSEHVYLDKPMRPKLSAGELPPEVVAKRDEVKQTLKEADDIIPTTEEDYQRLLTRCQNIFLSLIHPSIVGDDEVKQRIANILHKLYTVGKNVASTHKDLINLFVSAYNNSYLTDEAKPLEAQRKIAWLGYFRAIASKYYTAHSEIELNNLFGEYVPLGQLPKESEGLVTFEAEGPGDLFFCFCRSDEVKIRNGVEELYECVIDGWSKTKSAIRLDSLGKSVQEYIIDDNNLPILSSKGPVKLWFNLYKGHLLMGKGEPGKNIFLSWKDPYPVPRLHFAMVGGWATALTVTKVQILPALPMQVPARKKVKTKKRYTRLGIGINKPEKTSPDDDAEMMDLAELEAADSAEKEIDEPDEDAKDVSEPVSQGSAEIEVKKTAVEPAGVAQTQETQAPEEEPVSKNIPDVSSQEAVEGAS